MSQPDVNLEGIPSPNMPHLIINKLPFTLYLYSSDGIKISMLEPSGEEVKVLNFQQLIAPPGLLKRRYKALGHIPINHTVGQGQNEYLVPVVTPSFVIPRSLAVTGKLIGLPDAIPPDLVDQPRWYIVSEEAARLASLNCRLDVLTWDPSTLLFDEGHGKGVCRFVQW